MSQWLNTRQVVEEVVKVLESMSIFDRVSTGKVTPLVEDDAEASAYVGTKAVSYESKMTAGLGACGYYRTIFITIDINMLCKDSPLELLDIIDQTERTLLSDNAIWSVIIDRDMVGVDLDSVQFYPHRTATMLLEIVYQISNT